MPWAYAIRAFAQVGGRLDALAADCLVPLCLFIILNGIDDLVLDIAVALDYVRRRRAGAPAGPPTCAEKRIAIFVPLWHEHQVIQGMVRHNMGAIRYRNYDFFVGAYPNDEPTLDAVRQLEDDFANVHLAVCPHDGPTSKADCLNWVYQRMLLFEENHGVRFDVVTTHDAEDLIHPDALGEINRYASEYGMVQTPVLALPTPLAELVHGIYCDEFAEYQSKDVPARQILGSFLPSNGVGAAFTREALETLAAASGNRIFEPECLTEDYENGLRLHRLGVRQKFIRLSGGPNVLATREYFPRTLRGAIRQRTRWITGICLQSQERNGWRARPRDLYWFWRDRKGLLTNPLGVFANALFGWGVLSWCIARISGTSWELARHALHPALFVTVLCLQILHLSVRIACVARYYGWLFASLAPLRAVCANYINAAATFSALLLYFKARLRGEPLVWLKTEHAYPSRLALLAHKRPLAEILVGSAYATEADIAAAAASVGDDELLGEELVRRGRITEDDLCEALSLQHGLRAGRISMENVERRALRTLPRAVVSDLHVLPFRIADGSLFLATSRAPGEEVTSRLTQFTRLRVVFHLTTASNFEELREAVL